MKIRIFLLLYVLLTFLHKGFTLKKLLIKTYFGVLKQSLSLFCLPHTRFEVHHNSQAVKVLLHTLSLVPLLLQWLAQSS